jgi:hypothetical protein
MKPNRNTYFQVRKLVGGGLSENQMKIINAQPTQALKDARRRQFEQYNQQVQETEAKAREGRIPPGFEQIAEENARRNEILAQTSAEVQKAGSWDAYSYGQNPRIVFDPKDPNVPKASDGSRATSARKNRWGNWEIDYTDGSREFLPTGDTRFFLNKFKIFADSPQELLEKIQMVTERIKEEQRKRKEARSGFDNFMEGLNDALIGIADIGTLFVPGVASTVYDVFRPQTSSERNQSEIDAFVSEAVMTPTQAERTFNDLRSGRLHPLLQYDPELQQRIQDFDKYGPTLARMLQSE